MAVFVAVAVVRPVLKYPLLVVTCLLTKRKPGIYSVLAQTKLRTTQDHAVEHSKRRDSRGKVRITEGQQFKEFKVWGEIRSYMSFSRL